MQPVGDIPSPSALAVSDALTDEQGDDTRRNHGHATRPDDELTGVETAA